MYVVKLHLPGQNGKTFQAPPIPDSVTSHNLFRANETISFVITRAYLEKQRGQLVPRLLLDLLERFL